MKKVILLVSPLSDLLLSTKENECKYLNLEVSERMES